MGNEIKNIYKLNSKTNNVFFRQTTKSLLKYMINSM